MLDPSTPCIKVCLLDPHSGLCTGCGRTLEEIARWSDITEAERLALMAAARARLISPTPTTTAARCV
jgi:predicted Fe-S protein YdhL (DUF1289 family)